MQINPNVSYIPDERLEYLAYQLVEQYHREIEPVVSPPVPVEKIADFLLELGIEWAAIADTDDEPILAYIHPPSRTIRLNERRQYYFERYPGTYQFTLAHEVGHYALHLTAAENDPPHIEPAPMTHYLYRNRGRKSRLKDRREWQAERFAGYLLMPSYLLLPAIEGVDLLCWPNLYKLRDAFNVSITALKIRLENLGLLYAASNRKLYRAKQDAVADLRREGLELINNAKLYEALDQPGRAIACYERSLAIAYELDNKRDIAYRAWNLGLLYEAIDPTYAADLMAVCVDYERQINHPNAYADADRVANMQRISPDEETGYSF